MLKVGDVLKNIEAIDYSSEGLGVAKFEHYTLFISSLLKEEVGDVEILYFKGKDIAFGKTKKIHKFSPHRIVPLCPIHSACGGCSFQTITYEEELNIKRDKVKKDLLKIAHIDFEVKDVVGMENYHHYRNKIEIPIKEDKRKKCLIYGLYRKNSHDIISFSHCLLAKECLEIALAKVVDILNNYRVKAYDEQRHDGFIRHLVLRANERDEMMLTIVTKDDNIPQLDKIVKDIVSNVPNIKSIVLNIQDKKSNVILGEKERLLFGDKYLSIQLLNNKYEVSSKSFLQVNYLMCEKLYTRAIEIANLSKDDVVLDAYSGIGTIGLSVANKVKHVYGVEIVEDAIEDAKMNMKINNIGNASYVCGDAGEYMLHHQDIKFNVVFVDPPRKGLSSSFIDSLLKRKPKKIIYISCNPSTLARDLAILKDKYNIEAIEPFDMFPRTYHVETICALSFKGQK